MAEDYRERVADHAREIGAAIFRVAAFIRHPQLKAELEGAAVELVSKAGEIPYLSYVPKGVSLPYLPYIERLKNLIQLSEVVGEMKPVNSQVLQKELARLYSAIAECVTPDAQIDLSQMFKERESIREVVPEEPVFSQKTRQSAILGFIRQLPNGCRMRELLVKFPQVSERTLRYDLQTLVFQGLVERVGVQGPNSFFRANPPGGVTNAQIVAL